MTVQPSISIIVPVHNEQGNIAPLIEEISAALRDTLMYEIIYVDDGSSDATPQELQALHAAHPLLRVLQHDKSYGQSVAVATGVRHARHEWIGVLDGDGQNDPKDFITLWQWVKTKESTRVMAIGQRVKRQDTAGRKMASRMANAIRSFLLNDATPDSGCGLKIIHKSLFLELPFFNHMHRFMPALVKRAGGEVASIAVHHRPRGQGQSKYTNVQRLLVGITDILGVFWLLKRGARPIVTEIKKG